MGDGRVERVESALDGKLPMSQAEAIDIAIDFIESDIDNYSGLMEFDDDLHRNERAIEILREIKEQIKGEN